ncbi:hypothetical protein HYX11_01195 [Candidatus Woesearchaeota archaeon]|nr:hypothetical protein [Candidatus Woesearchaeota archaeon]
MFPRICFIVLILTIPLSFAQNDTTNVILTFADAITQEPIQNAFLSLDNNGEITNYYLEKNQNLNLKMSEGDHHLKIIVNNPTTPGNDYYGETVLSLENKLIKVIYLYPVGSLSGFVKDKVDIALSEANLNFDCNNALGVNFPKKTDKFGSFSLEYVPLGECKIYSSYKDSLGIKEITIKQGSKQYLEIKLDTRLITSQSQNYSPLFVLLFFGILLFVIGLSLYYHYFRKKSLSTINKKTKTIKQKKEKTIQKTSTRTADIFKTLRINEQKIVAFLQNQTEPIYFSKIHYQTGLSKSSLFRNLRSLEQKNIVETTKEGKIRKVKLTAWFLEQ